MQGIQINYLQDDEAVQREFSFQRDSVEEEQAKEELAGILPTGVFGIIVEHTGCDSTSAIMLPVESSNLSHVGYDPIMERLLIGFKKKTGIGLYLYHEIGIEVFLRLLASASVGKHFQQIKGDLGEFEKVSL